MKHIIIIGIITITASFLLAQGPVGSRGRRPSQFETYNPNTTSPPIELSAAYTLAQRRIGTATNSFYCVAASCIETTNDGFTGWTFVYANTNGQRGRVIVYFDGQVAVAANQGEVYIGH